MSRKSHDGSYVFILTRLNSVFIFFSRVLNFLVYFIQLCASRVYFLPTGVNTASPPLLIRRLYLDRSVQGYRLYSFILRVAFSFP